MIKKLYSHKSCSSNKATHQATFFDYEECKKEWLHEFSVEFREIDCNIGTAYRREEFEEIIKDYREIEDVNEIQSGKI